MPSDSTTNGTDIQIPTPVTIPDLIAVVLNADFPPYPGVSAERDHPGIAIHENLDNLPDHIEANATVHVDEVSEDERAPFGDWPEFVHKLQIQKNRYLDLTVDAEMTVNGGFKKAAYPSSANLRGGVLRLQLETSAGELDIRYQSDGKVYLTVGFDRPDECADPDDLREEFALPTEWAFQADKVDEQQVQSLRRLIRGE
jgi:hypothetical protein